MDTIMITDCILTLENESAFYKYFYLPFRNNIYKKLDKNTFDIDKAISGLQEQIRGRFKSIDCLNTCKYRYKYIPTKYILSKLERIEVAKELIQGMLNEKNE